MCRSKRGRGCCGSRCELQAPKPDGLSTNEEAPQAQRDRRSARRHRSRRPAARSSSGASRATGGASSISTPPSPANSTTSVANAMKSFAEYKYETGSTFQPEWEQYLTCCIPPRPISQRMQNRRVLEALAEQGDVHEIPRKVDHWLYFGDEASRAACRETLVAIDFAIEDEGIGEEDGGEHAVCAGGVARRQRGHAHHQRHHARARSAWPANTAAVTTAGNARSRAMKPRSSEPREVSARSRSSS